MDPVIIRNEHIQRFQITLTGGNHHTASCPEIHALRRVKMRNKSVCMSMLAYFMKENRR